jgi:excinuclease ABC subunit C
MLVFSGKSEYLANSLEKDMKKLAKSKNYEEAAGLRNQYLALKGLSTKIVFGKEETFDISLDKAMAELTSTIGLRGIPKRIECYDISNFAGGDAVSSMVVFTDGLPDQKQYRHFKMNTPGPNDFAMMQETLLRRFSKRNNSWPKPDLIIVDGGKGQLSSALVVLNDLKINIPIVGLAKRYETIIQKSSTRPVMTADDSTRPQEEYLSFNFDDKLPVLHLVQRIRDEAHRFAVSYHTVVRKKRTQKSELDSINGIGPVARKKLVAAFGSVRGIKIATRAEIAKVVGPAKAKIIDESLGLKG